MFDAVQALIGTMSRPVWGAWIEIISFSRLYTRSQGRAPYGARGLKCGQSGYTRVYDKVAPRMGRVD